LLRIGAVSLGSGPHQTFSTKEGNDFVELVPIARFEWTQLRVSRDEAASIRVVGVSIGFHKTRTLWVPSDIFTNIVKLGVAMLFFGENVVIRLILQFIADSIQRSIAVCSEMLDRVKLIATVKKSDPNHVDVIGHKAKSWTRQPKPKH